MNVAYRYPCDEEELDRMDMSHEMVKQLYDGKLHLSPLKDPKQILDIGAGSGIWAMEMGIFILSLVRLSSPLTPMTSVPLPRNRNYWDGPLTRPTNPRPRKPLLPHRRRHRTKLALAPESLRLGPHLTPRRILSVIFKRHAHCLQIHQTRWLHRVLRIRLQRLLR